MEPNTGIKTWQWVVTTIVVIAIIVVGVMIWGNGDEAVAPNNTQPTDNTSGQTTGTTNRIIVSDQYPGNVVYISSVQLAQPGWVVIHANDNGQPGQVLGSTYFNAGTNPGRVNLSRAMVDGGTYFAVLHNDNGDKTFSASNDPALRDSNGGIIMRMFRATTSAGDDIKG